MQGSLPIQIFGQVGGVSGGGGSAPWTPGGWEPVTLLAAAAFTYGQIGYLSAPDTVRLAFANGVEAQAQAVCICIDTTIGIGLSGRFVFGGRVPGLSGGTFNTLSYLSTTPGGMQTTPNVTAGQYNVLLGLWSSSTILNFNPQIPILN